MAVISKAHRGNNWNELYGHDRYKYSRVRVLVRPHVIDVMLCLWMLSL